MTDTVFLWRGFEHDWLRRVVGFATPHRISRFDSFIEHGAEDGARFHFGQAAGVDGNYMRPLGFFAGLRAPGVRAHHATARFEWTDRIEGSPPQARSDLERSLRVPIGDDDGPVTAALLSGWRIRSRCDDAKQPDDCPCNSDGLWPFRVAIALDPPSRDDEGAAFVPVRASIYRAWTPNKGGVPHVDIKPLNARLDIELEVGVTLLTGSPEALNVVSGEGVEARARARTPRSTVLTATHRGEPGYPVGVAGLTAFEFELLKTGRREKHAHLGRYLSNLRFRLQDGIYDPETGSLPVHHHCQIWIPKTVVPTRVRYAMRSALVQLGPGAEIYTNRSVRGRLCFNSTEQAPFYSRWCKCDTDPDKGPAQSEMSVPLHVPPAAS